MRGRGNPVSEGLHRETVCNRGAVGSDMYFLICLQGRQGKKEGGEGGRRGGNR